MEINKLLLDYYWISINQDQELKKQALTEIIEWCKKEIEKININQKEIWLEK
jgi:hypothetical protein